MHTSPIFDLNPDTKATVRDGLRNLTALERDILARLFAGETRARVCISLRMKPALFAQVYGAMLRTLGVTTILQAAVYIGAVEADMNAERASGILTHF